MFWLNLFKLILTLGEWWIYRGTVSATEVIAGPHDPLFDHGSSAEDQSYFMHLQQQLNELMAGSSTGRPTIRCTVAAAPKAVPWQSQLSGGFFSPHRRPVNGIDKKPVARRRVTHRPKDIAADRDGAEKPKNVTSNDYIDVGSPYTQSVKSTAVTRIGRIVFGTEDECVSANQGRACVCYMTDFLDLVGQRLNEVAAAENGGDGNDEAAALSCRSFKPVPTAFVLYPTTAADGVETTATATVNSTTTGPANFSADVMVERNGGKSGGRDRSGAGDDDKKAVAATPVWKEVDFDNVINYRLEKSSDDHYAVQYSLVGSDAKVQCVINGNGTKMNAFKWDFKKGKHKTNSTVTGTDTNMLLILGLEPGDSKNYTCTPTMDMVGGSKNGTFYKHYVLVTSKLSLIDTHFEPDYSRMSIKKFVSCAPGFGIREVFCAACPPHHYSPDKSIECLKCAKGFHQPIAGSEKCVKCRNIFSSGCYMKEVSPIVYYVTGLICLSVCSILVISCAFCCREENEKSIRIIPRKIRKTFKKTKKYSLLSSSQTEDTPDNSSVISKSYGKFKNLLKFKKKSKSKIMDSKITFNNVHEQYGQRIQNNNVTEENSTTN
ncbi:unnamed protein product [Aphis gossypii]|uniref:Ig-like domain-containing protein n=1 Tax=Aphis gossypii TaxID=80765 RepID=A0A9P0JET6_APHGO|nr:unnamed protein product [Aphis gossypii]